MNVHYYFDRNLGAWVRLPLTWELHSDFVKELIATIRVMFLLLELLLLLHVTTLLKNCLLCNVCFLWMLIGCQEKAILLH